MRIVIVAMFALARAVSIAEARPRHVVHRRYGPECNVSMPYEGIGKPTVNAKEFRRLASG